MPFKFNPLTGRLDIVDVSAPVPPADETTFVTDAGSAISVADSINVLGGANINTAGAGDTVTIALDANVETTSYATDNLADGLTIQNNTITADGTNANIDLGMITKGTGGLYTPNNLTVGQNSAITSIPYGGGTLDVAMLIDTEGLADLGGVVENRHDNVPAFGAHHILARSRGTHVAPTTIVSGDTIGRFASFGFDGTEYVESTEITSSATGTVAAGKVPGQLVISTADNVTGALQTAMTIDNGQTTTVPRLVGTANITASFTSPVLTTATQSTTYTNSLTAILQATNTSALSAEYYGAASAAVGNGSTLVFYRALGTKASPTGIIGIGSANNVLIGQLRFDALSGAGAFNGNKFTVSVYGNEVAGGILNFGYIGTTAGARITSLGAIFSSGGFFSSNQFTVTPTTTFVGPSSGTFPLGGSIQYNNIFCTSSTGGLNGSLIVAVAQASDVGGSVTLARSRGTWAATTAVQNNDMLGTLAYSGITTNTSTTVTPSTAIISFADNTVSSGVLPGRIVFYTANAVGTVTEAMRISSTQVTTLAQPLPVGSGGLGITTVPTNGQIPIGNGTTYTAATLTAGSNISITNAAGSVTIAASGVTTWQTISANQALVASNGYICISPGGALSLSLPATAAVGTIIEVVLAGATSWTVTQAAGQQVFMGNVSSTLGATGTVASTAAGDSIRMVCTVANTTWYVISSIGNINLT